MQFCVFFFFYSRAAVSVVFSTLLSCSGFIMCSLFPSCIFIWTNKDDDDDDDIQNFNGGLAGFSPWIRQQCLFDVHSSSVLSGYVCRVYDVVNRLPVWRPNNSINLYAYVHAWVILFLYISITRQHSTVTRDIDIANLSVRLCHGLCVRDVSGLYNIDKKGLTYCNSFFHRTVAQSL